MHTREAKESDFDGWLELRQQLYPDCSYDQLLSEIKKIYWEKSVVGELDYLVLLHVAEDDRVIGFIETSLRPEVPHFTTSPAGYVESLYVVPEFRGRGIATELVSRSETWVRSKGCMDFYVDTDTGYDDAYQFYLAVGFKEVDRNHSEILLKKVDSM